MSSKKLTMVPKKKKPKNLLNEKKLQLVFENISNLLK